MHSIRRALLVFGGAAVAIGATLVTQSVDAEPAIRTTVKYDAADQAEYGAMWANPYGLLEVGPGGGGTISVDRHGVTVDATPFTLGADLSVFDHLKYIGISTTSFDVPESGFLEFSVDITAQTPGTEAGRVIHGCYGASFSYQSLDQPCDQPWAEEAREGQQAGVVLNMINFETGQLFDWFISGSTAFALIERLPSNVTGSPGTPIDLAYTQVIKEVPLKPGKTHQVAIRYTRGTDVSRVEYFLDGKLFASVDDVGVPLDVQGVPFTGYAPALGLGEPLKDRLDSFVIGHGLFSLLDAFPYQHPDAPELSVSIPMTERLFGQGAVGTWDKFRVVTMDWSQTGNDL